MTSLARLLVLRSCCIPRQSWSRCRISNPLLSNISPGTRNISSLPSPVEEEKCPTYNPRHYYPAHIGETLRDRYTIISKLGWGSESTVWLAKDKKSTNASPYIALKITNCSPAVRTSAHAEKDISAHIAAVKSSHRGRKHVRLVLDSFDVTGPDGKHLCLVMEPLRQPLWMLGDQMSSDGLVPIEVIRKVMPMILEGLDFLHEDCGVIHTDLKGDNLMIPFEDISVLESYVEHQSAHPAPSTERNGRILYESRPDFGDMKTEPHCLRIADFGQAVYGDKNTIHTHEVQPLAFAAPEVVLKAGWNSAVDIWSLGLILWELLEEVTFLDGKASTESEFSHQRRFAQMIRMMGPPPKKLLERANPEVRRIYFDDDGAFKHSDLVPEKDYTFDTLTPILQGQEKKRFLAFARRMLQWLPEERATAKQLLDDPWLKSD